MSDEKEYVRVYEGIDADLPDGTAAYCISVHRGWRNDMAIRVSNPDGRHLGGAWLTEAACERLIDGLWAALCDYRESK